MENTKILLVGKAASGKDYFKSYLLKKGYTTSVSHTTRPMRKGEKDGKTYHFVTDDEFNYLIKKDNFFEWKKFNGWKYGTSYKEFYGSDVFIFTPGGINSLPKEFIQNSIIVYFNIPEEERVNRILQRSDSDDIKRRLESDEKDFKKFSTFDIEINDPFFKNEDVLEQIKMYIR